MRMIKLAPFIIIQSHGLHLCFKNWGKWSFLTKLWVWEKNVTKQTPTEIWSSFIFWSTFVSILHTFRAMKFDLGRVTKPDLHYSHLSNGCFSICTFTQYINAPIYTIKWTPFFLWNFATIWDSSFLTTLWPKILNI